MSLKSNLTPSQKLYWGIKNNDFQQVITSLMEGANCEELYQKYYPLTFAVKLGRTDIVKCLIKPSTAKSQISNLEIQKLLMVKGADINKINPNGNTALAYAVKNKFWDIVKYLINMDADVCRVGPGGRTSLSWAVYNSDIVMIKYLLNNGAEFTTHLALFDAICYQNLQIIQILNPKRTYLNINHQNGYTPLIYSIKIGNIEIVKYLLENGSIVNKTDLKGNIPIIQSIQCKNVEIVKLLIDHGADLNVVDNDGNCPLSKAVNMNSYQIVKHLVAKGATVNSTQKNHLLTKAAINNNIGIFDCLIKSGGEIDLVFTEFLQAKGYSYDFYVYLQTLKEEIEQKRIQGKISSGLSRPSSGREEAAY